MAGFPDFLVSLGDFAEFSRDNEMMLPFFLRQLADFAAGEVAAEEAEIRAIEQAILDVSTNFILFFFMI